MKRYNIRQLHKDTRTILLPDGNKQRKTGICMKAFDGDIIPQHCDKRINETRIPWNFVEDLGRSTDKSEI